MRALSSLLVFALSFGCREFRVCEDEDAPCARQHSPSPISAEAGTGLSCSGSSASCDQSTLNGCETDLTISAGHCGACGCRCLGVCAGARCKEYEVAAANQREPEGALGFSSDFVFFLAQSTFESTYRLQRHAKATGITDVLAEDEFGLLGGPELAVGAATVYVRAAQGVFAVPFAGGEPSVSDLPAAAIASRGGGLYWIEYDGVIRERDVFGEDRVIASLPRDEAWSFERLAVAKDWLVASAFSLSNGLYGHQLFQVNRSDGAFEPIVEGEGELKRLKVAEAAAFWSVTPSRQDEVTQIWTWEPEREPRLIFEGEDVSDFTAGDALAFVNVTREYGSTLLGFFVEDPWRRTEFGVEKRLRLPAIDVNLLWYVDEESSSLVSIPTLDLMEVTAGSSAEDRCGGDAAAPD